MASTRIETVEIDDLVATSGSIEIPMATDGISSENGVTFAQFTSLPTDRTRWCEIPIELGASVVYGPGSLHAGIDRPGLGFTFVVVPMDTLQAVATQLRIVPQMPKAGEVRSIPLLPATRAVSAAYADLRLIDEQPEPGSYPVAQDVTAAIARALCSDDDRSQRNGVGTRINSRRVVADCIDYANAIDRIPSVAELCLVAHVSERRLRQAFNDEFEVPPTRYFRLWALTQANRRLRRAVTSDETVTNVAARLGFFHLGRFSGHYKRVYGEPPSATLKADLSAG